MVQTLNSFLEIVRIGFDCRTDIESPDLSNYSRLVKTEMVELEHCIEIKNWSWVDNMFELLDMTADLSAVAAADAAAGTVVANHTERADKLVEKTGNNSVLG